jgi:SAM-dependent methyltransferase
VSEIHCDLCGCDQFSVVESCAPPCRVLRCQCCSLVFVHPFPSADILRDHYSDDYYREWIDAQRDRRLAMWEARLNRLERRTPRGRILDVGCGEGAFLELAAARGWEIWGTELSVDGARHSSARLGREMYRGELHEARLPSGFFDVVTLWHVLEHVRQPSRYLDEIRRILRPDGLCVIAVPNVDDLFMRAAYRIVRGRPPRLYSGQDREIHLFHFSAATIDQYLKKAGFNVCRIGPDFGIIEHGKRIINLTAAAFLYVSGLMLCNALEVHARPAVCSERPRGASSGIPEAPGGKR